MSTSPLISNVTTFGFATTPFTEISTFKITSASSLPAPRLHLCGTGKAYVTPPPPLLPNAPHLAHNGPILFCRCHCGTQPTTQPSAAHYIAGSTAPVVHLQIMCAVAACTLLAALCGALHCVCSALWSFYKFVVFQGLAAVHPCAFAITFEKGGVLPCDIALVRVLARWVLSPWRESQTDAILAACATVQDSLGPWWNFYTMPTGVPEKLKDAWSPVRILVLCINCVTPSASCSPCLTTRASAHFMWSVWAVTSPIAKMGGSSRVH